MGDRLPTVLDRGLAAPEGSASAATSDRGEVSAGSAGGGVAVPSPGRGRHLAALDVVRVLTVGLVISVHAVSSQPGGVGWSNGAVLMVMHVSREVFFLLTAFVLTYAYRGQPWPAFWRRRFLLVGVPYLVWTAIYELAAGDPWRFPIAVLTGTGSYHLYFLLVSMQLYLVFPLLRRLLRAAAGHHGALFAAAVAYQATAYALLPRVIAQPDALLISYLGFVVVGGIAAWHAEALLAWTASHRRTVFWSTAAVVAAGLGWFALRTLTFSNDPATASAVFQPAIVAESIAVAWTFLALGLTWRGASVGRPVPGSAVGLPLPGPAVGRPFPGRLFRTGADVSFGVYLGHPLLLQGLLAAGLGTLVAGLPQPVITFLTLAVAVPAVYLICAVVARALRRTPLSLALTGHPAAAPVVPVSPGGLRCERQTA